jgi:hypothetical protein
LERHRIGSLTFEQQEGTMDVESHVVSHDRMARRFTCYAIILCIAASVGSTGASAQITGSPVSPSGQPTLSGQPYVKTHKRHNKNFYGRHYNVYKHSKH